MIGRELSIALAALAAGCWVPLEKGAQLEREILALQDRQRDSEEAIQKQKEAQEQRILEALARLTALDAQVNKSSAALQEKLDELNRTATRTGANLGADMEKALAEITTLRGALEEQAHELENLKTAVEAGRTVTESRLAKLEEKPKAPDKPPEPSKQELYDEALKKLEAGDTAAARAGFTTFRDKFKDDPLAPNAQYWIGETYYAEGKYREAIVEFQRIQDQYKASDKAPDALLKLGFAFVALGLKDDGVLFLEEVEKKHPNSPAAQRARAKLKELKRNGKKK